MADDKNMIQVDEVVQFCGMMGRKVTTDEANVALNKALLYLDFYSWRGKKLDKNQPFEWPRTDRDFKGIPAPLRRVFLRLAMVALDVEINGEFVKGRELTGYSQSAPSGASRSFSYNSSNKGERLVIDWFERAILDYLNLNTYGAQFPVFRG